MNDTQFGRVLCLSAILMVAFAATASAEDGWVISDRLSIVLPSGAKFNLDLEDIDEAIQYGKRFDSQQALFRQFAKLGYQKTIPGFIAVTDVFLVTDFIRVAAHSAAAQRRNETLDARALQEKLHGRLDIVVLTSVEHGYRGVKPVLKPVLSIRHDTARYVPETDVDLGVYSNCAVLASDPVVTWEDLCKVISEFPSAWEANGMWLFSFLPQGNWDSTIEVVLGESPEPATRLEFDFSKLKLPISPN